jgi:hypothetical protein
MFLFPKIQATTQQPIKSKEFKMSIPAIPFATPYPYRVSPTD